jgi:glycosyltransferase involved in cell wall biosynthesis
VQNEDAFAQALSVLVDNKEWRKELGEQALQTVATSYSVEKMARQIEKVYIDVFEGSYI